MIPAEGGRGPLRALPRRAVLAAWSIGWFAVFWPVFQKMKDTGDYVAHVGFAREMVAGGSPHSERFGFELLTALAAGFSSDLGDLFFGAVLVSVLAMICKLIVSARLIEDEVSFGWSLVLASILILLAPITLDWTPNLRVGGISSAVYLGQISGLVIHNPTTVASFALALLLFRCSWQERPVLTAVLAASQCLIKPNFVVAWLPVFALVVAWRRRKDPPALARMGAALVPVVGVLAFQLLTSEKVGSQWILAPFAIWRELSGNIFLSCVRSLAFPALFTVAYFGEIRRWGELWFAWAIFGVAFAQYSLILMLGPIFRGDWAWGRYYAIYILFLLCLARFARICARSDSWETPWRISVNATLLVLLTLHLQAGVVYLVQAAQVGRW